MESVSGGLADLDYCRRLERELPASIAFLEEHGVDYIYFKQPLPNRNTGGGLGMPAGNGLGIVDGLAAVLERTDGADLVYETEAVRLSVSAEGRVDGVVVRGRDGLLRTIRANSVVIASGGFEGNKEMLTQYLGERACDIPVISPGTANNRGEGIRMAVEVGADTAGQFDRFHAEPVDPRATKPDPVVYPYPYGIVVNGRAQRFFDEGKNSFDSTFEALGYEIWRNQDQTAFLIADQTSLSVNGLHRRRLLRRAARHRRHARASSRASSASTRPRSRRRSRSTTRPPTRASSTPTASTASTRSASRCRSPTGRSRSTRRRFSPTRCGARSASPSAACAPTRRRAS